MYLYACVSYMLHHHVPSGLSFGLGIVHSIPKYDYYRLITFTMQSRV